MSCESKSSSSKSNDRVLCVNAGSLSFLSFPLRFLFHDDDVLVEVLLGALWLVPADEELADVVPRCHRFRVLLPEMLDSDR